MFLRCDRKCQDNEVGKMDKEFFMRRAIELAKRGEGYTAPNPMVGCVVVKDGEILNEGYHRKYGEYHAERNALLTCGEEAMGAEVYVTLEPCCHHGKTPPCTDIIIEKGISKVYVGSVDPNPLVGGKGIQILEEHGIEVETGILEEECRKLNEAFFHYMETGMPYLIMKYAMTLDGKIACVTGDSQWITDIPARRHVHALRKKYTGIMVGIGTVLSDDPMLDCRIESHVDPIRIICDSSLRIPMESRLVQTAKRIPVIVACREDLVSDEEHKKKIEALEYAGVTVLTTTAGPKGKGINLEELLKMLGERKIDSILLEGGGTLNASALKAGLVNKVFAYVAGKMVGGREAKSPIEGMGIEKMCDAICLCDMKVELLDDDVCISGYIRTGAKKNFLYE